MWILYQLALGLALLLAAPVLLLRKGRHYLPTVRGRLGGAQGAPSVGEDSGGPPRRPLWLHAVSVGEAEVAATLMRALPADLAIVVTTVTPTGQARAQAAAKALPNAGRIAVAYLPIDLGFAIRRFVRRFDPAALVMVEGDLWPLVLRAAKRRGLPIVVVNGRVSDRGYGRMLRWRPFLTLLLGRVDRFAVQSALDRDRLVALGVPSEQITVTGNLKYETPEPRTHPDLERLVLALAAGRPVLLAGSTMPAEEEQVLAAFSALGGGARALLLLAPRHPERFPAVAALLESAGLPFRRRSALGPGPGAAADSAAAEHPAVILLDSLGELAGLYRIARAAFVGGTLVATGGHNPLEPARFAVPVAVGPSMHNFREMAEHFDRAGAWRRVRDAGELGETWSAWLDDPAAAAAIGRRGAALLDAQRGALARTLEFLEPVLAAVQARRP